MRESREVGMNCDMHKFLACLVYGHALLPYVGADHSVASSATCNVLVVLYNMCMLYVSLFSLLFM